MGPSGTSARQRTAMRPARFWRARSSLGRAVRDVIPFAPAWVWTSIEMLSRNRAVASARGASDAAGASARVPAQPASMAPAELSVVAHIQSRRVSAWPQHVMGVSLLARSLSYRDTAEVHVQLGDRVKPTTRARCAYTFTSW